jgi:hypothetical protein
MKKYLLLILLAGCGNPSCNPQAMKACSEMCGMAGVQAFDDSGCHCRPSVFVPTTPSTPTPEK